MSAPFALKVVGTEPHDRTLAMATAIGRGFAEVDYAMLLLRDGRVEQALAKLSEARDALAVPFGSKSTWDRWPTLSPVPGSLASRIGEVL